MHSHRYPSRYAARWWITAAAIAAGMLAVTGTAYAVVTARSTVDCDKPASSPVDDRGRFRVTLNCVGPAPALSASVSASASPGTTTPVPSTSPPATSSAPAPSTSAPSVNCLAQLAACGFPYALSTGPVGPLTVSTRTQYTTAGETVSGVDIRGCVEVRATGVTFRNVRITGPCFYVVRNFSSGLSIIDSELSCNGENGTAVTATGYALTRVDIHNCENGLNVGGNVSMVDSWVHDMETDNGAHTDGAQINQGATNITLRHNTIVVPAGGTSAIISWDEVSPQQQNVAIDRNLLSGGTYTLYCPREGTSDTRVTGNRFGAHEYGFSNACVGTHVSAWSGNVIDATGATLGPD